MAKEIFKTKFSIQGLCAALLFFFPHSFLWLPARRFFLGIEDSPKWFLVIYVFSAIALLLTLVLVRNAEEPPFSKKSRCMSFACIMLGIYYILWVYFLIGKSSTAALISTKVFGSGFLIFFSLDRRNWLSLGFSVLFMVLGLAITVIALIF